MLCFLVLFVTFPYGVLGHVCYLIVSIPDICPLPHLHVYTYITHVDVQITDNIKRYSNFAFTVERLKLSLNMVENSSLVLCLKCCECVFVKMAGGNDHWYQKV